MADALKYITECPVCMLTYVNPKVLPCDHSLCESCVDGVRKGSTIKCPLCNSSHSVNKIRADFRLSQILEALELKNASTDSDAAVFDMAEKCELCCKQVLSFWCEDCQQWICIECKTSHARSTATRDHVVTAANPASKRHNDDICRQLMETRRDIHAMSKSIATLDNDIDKLTIKQQHVLHDSANLRNKSLKDINDYFDSLDVQIIEFFQRHMERIKVQKCFLSKKIQEANKRLQDLEEKVERCTAILSEADSTMVKVEVNEVCIRVLPGKDWDPSSAAELEFNAMDYSLFSFSDLVQKEISQLNQVSLENYPNSLRLIGKDLWSCQHSGCIQIFSLTLEHKRTMKNPEWGRVNDAVALEDDEVILATANGLYHIEPNGDVKRQIDAGKYYSLALYQNRMYASVSEPPKIRVYSTTGLMQKLSTLKLPFSSRAYVTLDVKKTILACSDDDGKVIGTSQSHAILNEFGSRGCDVAGKLNTPFLCQTDTEGTMLLADSRNHRLQTADSRGRWNVLSLNPAVSKPRGAVFADNTLYVASRGGGNKLSMYTCS